MSNEEKYPPLRLQLVGLSETNWIMEGTEKDPKRMAWPSLLRIIPTSKVRVDMPDGKYRYRQIRHIAGCDSIDPVEQDKDGFKPNLEQDNIWISMGNMTVNREGSTIGTYDYLKNYQGNTSNPMRPPDAEDEFEEVVEIEIAKILNVSFDKKADAYAILREIRQPLDGGYVYEEEKLALISTLFGLNHLDSNEEKFAELYRIADSRPELIVKSIANGKKKLFALIKKAEELQVIEFADDRVMFTDPKSVILTYKGRVSKNTQINKLSDFLLSEVGKPFLLQLEHGVDNAANKSLEPVKAPVKETAGEETLFK